MLFVITYFYYTNIMKKYAIYLYIKKHIKYTTYCNISCLCEYIYVRICVYMHTSMLSGDNCVLFMENVIKTSNGHQQPLYIFYIISHHHIQNAWLETVSFHNIRVIHFPSILSYITYIPSFSGYGISLSLWLCLNIVLEFLNACLTHPHSNFRPSIASRSSKRKQRVTENTIIYPTIRMLAV